MEGSIAEELYSESLQLSKIKLDPPTSANNEQNCDGDNLSIEDGPIWDSCGEELDEASDLDREWQRRHDQYHTIGYRDGVIAGKEDSAQEGFNIGFKQSVLVGYNWGVVRGVTSALASLPDGLKERLIETQEKRNKFKDLYESVHSLSTTDALRLFNDDIMEKKALKQSENEASSHVARSQQQSSDCIRLKTYLVRLQSHLSESPSLEVHFLVDESK